MIKLTYPIPYTFMKPTAAASASFAALTIGATTGSGATTGTGALLLDVAEPRTA